MTVWRTRGQILRDASVSGGPHLSQIDHKGSFRQSCYKLGTSGWGLQASLKNHLALTQDSLTQGPLCHTIHCGLVVKTPGDFNGYSK